MTVRRRLGLLELSEQLGVMVQEVYEALSKFGLLRPEDVKQFKPSKVHRNAGAGTALSGPP